MHETSLFLRTFCLIMLQLILYLALSVFALIVILAVVYILLTAISSITSQQPDSEDYEEDEIFANIPDKTEKNQKYYKSLARSNRFVLNDLFNIHPGNSNLGEYGEFLTFKEIIDLSQEFNFYYKILNNMHIGVKTEIDMVWIHETGIYVFESKNYSGWIFGNLNSKNWCKTMPRKKEFFYNPIWQNEGHIKAIQRILGNIYPYYSIIVFSERCELKDVPENTSTRIILKRNNLSSAIRQKISSSQRVISPEQIDTLHKKLNSFNDKSTNIQQRHNDYVKTKQNQGRKPNPVEDDDLPF